MKLIMMGSGPYAVPTFEALLNSRHEVSALVTQPLRAAAKHNKPLPISPMRAVADARGLAILDPPDVNTEEAVRQLADLRPELYVVCDYGQILRPATLAVGRLGGINLHASLLPKYRGAAPINWALYHGDTETGNTVLHMTPRIDAGPCLAQEKVAIDPHESAVELETRLARLGAALVLSAIDDLEAGRTAVIVQDPSLATRAPRLKKSDGQVDWSRTAEQIRNQIRAFKPWPGTYTQWVRAGAEPLRLILDAGRLAMASGPPNTIDAEQIKPGTVFYCGDAGLIVNTGGGLLSIDRIQPAGKRVMDSAEFLRGYPVKVGDRLS
ncbi:MAG: methionyl-tRNA formyltransferase [Planctomycetia bacterium]|nr:methionyl-tRNA formyltransferase [Planctomycetia bacterium]